MHKKGLGRAFDHQAVMLLAFAQGLFLAMIQSEMVAQQQIQTERRYQDKSKSLEHGHAEQRVRGIREAGNHQ